MHVWILAVVCFSMWVRFLCMQVKASIEKMSSFSITRKKTPFQKHREEEEAKKKVWDSEIFSDVMQTIRLKFSLLTSSLCIFVEGRG